MSRPRVYVYRTPSIPILISNRFDPENQVLAMTFEKAMGKGSTVALTILFQSQLNDKDVGTSMSFTFPHHFLS